MQRFVRRHLAQRLYRRVRAEVLEATGKLQRAFRGFRSRKIRNALLQAREMRYRRHGSHLLSAEEEFLLSKLSMASKRVAQTRIRER
jgi:hypothetical protein